MMIYFDTAASFPMLKEVKKTLSESYDSLFANSSSSHLLGTIASEKINGVREQLADEIGAYPSEIIFTSGATESNNIAFKSLLLGEEIPNEKKHLVTTQIEHKCIHRLCNYFESIGYEITYLKPNNHGIIETESVRKAIRPDTALVSIMHVNNELGSINPIGEIGNVCNSNNILFHSDAAQSFKKIEIDVDEMNIDLMSFSAHKIAGPKGIGAIYIRDLRKKMLMPVIHGAGQEEGLRGGTVATPLVLGFGKAIETFSKYYTKLIEKNAINHLEKQLAKNNIPYNLNGNKYSLASCVSISLPNTNTALLIREYENKLCLAQGSACSSKEIEASHVLTALGMTRDKADKTLRLSFPLDLNLSDIDQLVNAIKSMTT